jgi:hypothetical protein
MIKVMFVDFLLFVIIYLICILGFGIFFYGIYIDQPDFKTGLRTFTTLFQYSISDFNYSNYSTSSDAINAIGT